MFIAMKKTVHLNALRALEASARHQSFSAAAEELNVTPAAVGQLVRTLEDWVGTPLFYRKNSGKFRLVPTKTAESALADIRVGLDKLALGLEKLQAGSNSGVLTVTVSPAFAAKWLLPRIDRFHSILASAKRGGRASSTCWACQVLICPDASSQASSIDSLVLCSRRTIWPVRTCLLSRRLYKESINAAMPPFRRIEGGELL